MRVPINILRFGFFGEYYTKHLVLKFNQASPLGYGKKILVTIQSSDSSNDINNRRCAMFCLFNIKETRIL